MPWLSFPAAPASFLKQSEYPPSLRGSVVDSSTYPEYKEARDC